MVVIAERSDLDETNLHGLLVLNKPKGMISKDVSRVLHRRVFTHKVRMGHVGSLDPLAEGVLPMTIGAATRLQNYILDSHKSYDVVMVFGFQTDTMDVTGVPTSPVALADAPSITPCHAQQVLAALRGKLRQVPPLYSAVKYKGQPLYKWARTGRAHEVDLTRLAREVEIFELTLIKLGSVSSSHADFAHCQSHGLPDRMQTMAFRVECSKGTYIRSICDTIGRILGQPATMLALTRLKTGGVELAQALTLDELIAEPHLVSSALIPLADIPLGLPRLELSAQYALRFTQGQRLVFAVDLAAPESDPHQPKIVASGAVSTSGMGASEGYDLGYKESHKESHNGRGGDKIGDDLGCRAHPWWPVIRRVLNYDAGTSQKFGSSECLIQGDDGTVLGLGSLRLERRIQAKDSQLSVVPDPSLVRVELKQKRGLRS